MLRLAWFSVVMVLCFGFVEHSLGQVVVEVEFDNTKAKYLCSYKFGAYGPADGSEAVAFGDQISCDHLEETSAGRPASLAGLEARLKESKDSSSNEHKAIQAKIDKLVKTPNSCAKLEVDTSAVDLPSDAIYSYAGAGLGVNFDLTDVELPSLNAEDYQVVFDAKVTGTETLKQSKLVINFVTEDGDDEDNFDDVVVKLLRGDDDGADNFAITSEYQTFSFGLDSMTELEGKMSDLKGVKLIGITISVQAQGSISDFGTDDDNVLYVDNIRLIKK